MLSSVVPVDGYRGHGVDAGEHSGDGEKVVEPAVHFSKVPLSVSRVNEVNKRVESSHRHIRESQVKQKIIGHGPHTLVRQYNPNYNEVPENRHSQHGAVSHRPQSDAPRRLHKLVGQISGGVGPVPFRGHSSSVLRRICVSPLLECDANQLGTSDAQHTRRVSMHQWDGERGPAAATLSLTLGHKWNEMK